MNISRNIYERKSNNFFLATVQKIAIYSLIPLLLIVIFEAIVKNLIFINLINLGIAVINKIPRKKVEVVNPPQETPPVAPPPPAAPVLHPAPPAAQPPANPPAAPPNPPASKWDTAIKAAKVATIPIALATGMWYYGYGLGIVASIIGF